MKPAQLLFLFFTLIHSSLMSQQHSGQGAGGIQQESPIERKVVFIDLREYPNSAFSKGEQRVEQLIYEALLEGRIPAYKVNYDQHIVDKLSKEEWKKTLWLPYTASIMYKYKKLTHLGVEYRYINYYRDGSKDETNMAIILGQDSTNWERVDSIYYGNQPLSYVDITRIGLDQSTQKIKDNFINQVHYVNFYGFDYRNGANEENPYYFYSVTWEDFIKVLETKNKLYYTNSFDSWWRGEIFVSDGLDIGQYSVGYLDLMRGRKDFTPYSFSNPGKPINIMKYTTDEYWAGFPYELFIKETLSSDTSSFLEIGIEEKTVEHKYTGKRLVFRWSDFLTIAKDSNWHAKSYLSTMADAFRTREFVTDDTLSFVVSRNGYFLDGTSDPLFGKTFVPSYPVKKTREDFNQLSLSLTQGINTEDPLNKGLNGAKGLSSMILSYIRNEKIVAYANDTLEELITKEKLNQRILNVGKVQKYNTNKRYRKGDIVKDSEGIVYKVLKDVEPNHHEQAFVRHTLDHYSPDSLSHVEVKQTIRFNEKGYNKKYTTNLIGIYVPKKRSLSGYLEPVCFVKWDELKILLQKDGLDKLIEIIEKRLFFSYLQETGVIQIAE